MNSQAGSRVVETVTEKDDDFLWVGKEQMISMLGQHKAQAKIDSGKMEHQPDPTTGLKYATSATTHFLGFLEMNKNNE